MKLLKELIEGTPFKIGQYIQILQVIRILMAILTVNPVYAFFRQYSRWAKLIQTLKLKI